MQAPKRIVVTTDFSETSKAAFSLARQIAEKFDAELTLLHVVEVQLPPLVLEPGGIGIDELEKQCTLRAGERLKAFAAELGDDVQTQAISGTAHVEVVRFAEDHDIDLIVMATHGRGFCSHAILGSTTERVGRRAHCPLLTVRDLEAGKKK